MGKYNFDEVIDRKITLAMQKLEKALPQLINDKLEEVAKYFNSDSKSLKSFNKFKDDRFVDSQTVINPSVENIDAFNKNFEITISMSSEKSY